MVEKTVCGCRGYQDAHVDGLFGALGDQNQLPLASYAVENWKLNCPDLSLVASLATEDRPCFL